MSEKARSVSIAGSRNYLDGLKVVAARRKVRVADLVREALDSSFGDEIERAIAESASFFTSIGSQMNQIITNEPEVTNER